VAGLVGGEQDDHLGDLVGLRQVPEGTAGDACSRTAGVTQPVSVTGGWTMFEVMPNRPSSWAAAMV
jgi:hypothetical protein